VKNTDHPALAILYQPVEALAAYPHNARTHSRRQLRQIAQSIKIFGFTNPILIDQNNTIIAGHGRVEAAKLLGIAHVPTIRLDGLTEDQLRAYVLADNRLAEKAGWDQSILSIELQHLLALDTDLDVTVTGFEVPEIDLILSQAQAKPDASDVFDIDRMDPAVTRVGDIWKLGKHRILCGNSLDISSFRILMNGHRAHVVFADPPYNVPIDGHASGNGLIHHREFVMATGEMNEAEFVAFLTTSLRLLSKYSVTAAVHFICIDWRHLYELISAGRQVYDVLLNVCVWAKNNGGMGSLYRSRHELVLVFRNGQSPHTNNVMLGKYGRNRSNVWEYPGATTLSKQGEDGNVLALHPTVKPVALVADALLDCSARRDLVLDSFLGSGSTLLAAERVGRTCFGIEIDPLYVDTAIRRWQKNTGERAVRLADGKYFDDLTVPSEAASG
jgi:DNA modification methylase